MNRIGVWIGQGLLYAGLAVTIGVFSRWPVYQNLAPDRALIKISFSHHGQLLGDCIQVSAEDLAKLPPTMRAPTRCPRERSPLTVEVDIDGVPVLRQLAQPSGLSRDGAAVVYRRLEVAAGSHVVDVRMKDDARSHGFDHVHSATVVLSVAEILVIDFDSAQRRITFR